MGFANMGTNNTDLEAQLEKLPDSVATALMAWRVATLNREKTEALLYMSFRVGAASEKRTAEEIKALVRGDNSRYDAVMVEIKAESDYERLYERLMSLKKRADLRTAF